jgi:flagellar basal-body rod protein FlgC
MNLFGTMEVSGSALAAERWRAEVVSANMANAGTTRTPLMLARLEARARPGVRVDGVVPDASPLPRRYEPGHPDADAAGYVTYPNVNPVLEMTDLLGAVRAYQLNISAVQAAKSMIQQSLQILI